MEVAAVAATRRLHLGLPGGYPPPVTRCTRSVSLKANITNQKANITNLLFQDPRQLLHSRFSHGLIFNLLYRAVQQNSCSENITSLAVFLLELALSLPQTGVLRQGGTIYLIS